MDINDLQNYFYHDEDEEHEPQIFKQTAYIDLEKNEKDIQQKNDALSMNYGSVNNIFVELINTLQYLEEIPSEMLAPK